MGSRLENLRGIILSKAQGNNKNHYNPTGGWQLLGGGFFLVLRRPVRPLPSCTQSVLLNATYGIEEFLSSNTLCGFVTVHCTRSPSTAPGNNVLTAPSTELF